MDALAGYGSDDSSASCSSSLSFPKAQQVAKNDGIVGLLGTCSESDENDSSGIKAPAPPSKKPRMATSYKLPEPLLAKDENDSWILWKTNYLEKPIHEQLRLGGLPATQQLQENLQRLAQNIGNIPSWAEHLQAQHEFHNPHFFESVVEHFGIQDPLASWLSEPGVREYERNLFPVATKEEGDD